MTISYLSLKNIIINDLIRIRTIQNSISYSFKHTKHKGSIFTVSVVFFFIDMLERVVVFNGCRQNRSYNRHNIYYIPVDCKTKTSKSLFATMIPAAAPLTKDVEKCFRSKDQSVAGKFCISSFSSPGNRNQFLAQISYPFHSIFRNTTLTLSAVLQSQYGTDMNSAPDFLLSFSQTLY